jgi:hypothetical protein
MPSKKPKYFPTVCWRKHLVSDGPDENAWSIRKTVGTQMIKRTAQTIHHISTGSAHTALAEFFVLAVFCSSVMMFFASS